jgi:hypothetical protein
MRSPSRRPFRSMRPWAWLCLTAVAFVVPTVSHAQTNPGVSPLPGIAIPDADRAELTAESGRLQADLTAAVQAGRVPERLRDLVVDVEIFPKAVSWALELDGFHDLKQLATARTLLAAGRGRLEALVSGTAPWTTDRGLVVRGFRSRIDGSVQPYGLVVPADLPAAGGRLDIWLHGRNDKLSELAFLADRMRSPGEFTPPRTLVLHPYGRFCNAFKFAGETDVLEALEDAIRRYRISPDHVALRGFSMGGAGAWHLGAHHTGRWAVIAPGAGFVETAKYAKVFAPGKPEPPAWEQTLWRLYDVPVYAANLTNRPVFAYSGADDPQKQAADIMVAAVRDVGGDIPHLVAAGTGHRYEPETKKRLASLVDAAADAGRPRAPDRVRLTTSTLRYHTIDWVEITGLVRHWEPGTIDARRTGPRAVAVTTSGVTSFAVTPPSPATATAPWIVTVDGERLEYPATATRMDCRRTAGGWAAGAPPAAARAKRHGLQGPIDDAFMDRFVFVRPTGKAWHPAVDAWVRGELARAIETWRVNFRGVADVVDDTAVTPQLMRDAHLVLWGDPQSNRVLADVLPGLPLGWTAAEIVVAGQRHDAATHAAILIHPNPRAPDRYVVLNSSYTFRQGSSNTNALQTPKLPDWAVIDLRTPPSSAAPGLVKAAGFCDEFWRIPAATK